MGTLATALSIIHLVGLVLGLGAATVKIVLLLKSRVDPAFLHVYLRASKPITKLIVLGTIILILSGIGWLFYGYSLSTLMIVKIVLVAAMFGLGMTIDNAVEPKVHKLAPAPNETPSPEFREIQKLHFALEVAATLLFYAIFAVGVAI